MDAVMTENADAVRARYDAQIIEREISLSTLDAEIQEALEAEGRTRAAAIMGEATEADADRVTEAARALLERRRILGVEINGLKARQAEAIKASERAECTDKLEREVTPAAIEFVDYLRRIEAATVELGVAMDGAISVYKRAFDAWPLRGDYQPQPMNRSAAGFSSLNHGDFLHYIHAMISAASNESLPYRALPPIHPIYTTGAEIMQHAQPFVERFGTQWAALLEHAADRPDLANKVRERVEMPNTVRASKRNAKRAA